MGTAKMFSFTGVDKAREAKAGEGTGGGGGRRLWGWCMWRCAVAVRGGGARVHTYMMRVQRISGTVQYNRRCRVGHSRSHKKD